MRKKLLPGTSTMTQQYRRPGELAQLVRDRFDENAKARGTESPDPSVAVIERLLDIAFFASLLAEEGRPVRVCLAYAPEIMSTPLPSSFRRLSSAIPLNPRALRKIAPALNPHRSMIAVRSNGVELEMWALIHHGSGTEVRTGDRVRYQNPRATHAKLTVTTFGPGSIDVNCFGEQLLAFRGGTSVARRLGESPSISLVLERALNGFEKPPLFDMQLVRASNALTKIVGAIGSANHGGTIIITNGTLHDPMLEFNPSYTFEGGDQSLKDAVHTRATFVRTSIECVAGGGDAMVTCADDCRMQADLAWREAAEYVANLAGVDGAVVLTFALEILGFGVMIKSTPRNDDLRVLHQNALDTPATMKDTDFARVGGARHQSAVRWCSGHPNGGFAIVVSQDGDITVVNGLSENCVNLLGPLYSPVLE